MVINVILDVPALLLLTGGRKLNANIAENSPSAIESPFVSWWGWFKSGHESNRVEMPIPMVFLLSSYQPFSLELQIWKYDAAQKKKSREQPFFEKKIMFLFKLTQFHAHQRCLPVRRVRQFTAQQKLETFIGRHKNKPQSPPLMTTYYQMVVCGHISRKVFMNGRERWVIP